MVVTDNYILTLIIILSLCTHETHWAFKIPPYLFTTFTTMTHAAFTLVQVRKNSFRLFNTLFFLSSWLFVTCPLLSSTLFSIRRWFWTKGGMHFSKVHWLDSFRICDRISIGSSSCYITNIHKTCFTIKMWSLFVRIKRLRYSSSLLHSFEYPRVENRTSVDCGKLFNKRLPSKHVNIRNWGAMSQQKQKWYIAFTFEWLNGIKLFFIILKSFNKWSSFKLLISNHVAALSVYKIIFNI